MNSESLPKFKIKNGWAILETPRHSQPLTNEVLDASENADYGEEYERAFSRPGIRELAAGTQYANSALIL